MSEKWETEDERKEKQKKSPMDDINGERSHEYFGIVS